MALIKLSKGLYSAYTALSTKDANTVYFCTDSGHLYLGTTLLVGGSVTSVTHNSDTEVITIVTQTGTGAQSTTVDLGVYLKENTPITASTGKSFVKYDTKGLVTGGGDLTLSDLPSIAQNTFLGRTDSGTGVVSALGRDSLLGLTSNGFVKRTGVNTYAIDTATYAEASNVALRDANSPIVPKFWVGTETQYNAIETKDSAVVYIIL